MYIFIFSFAFKAKLPLNGYIESLTK